MSINARGAFNMTAACLPHMYRGGWGHVINMSPPIQTRGTMSGRTAYNISKFGMSMVALGVAEEGRERNVAGNCLWPATIIESLASINFQMGDRSLWRKADILADCVCSIVCRQPSECTGNTFIDDDYLREFEGFNDDDFVKYRCDPDCEPPLLLKGGDGSEGGEWGDGDFRRGNIRELDDSVAAKNRARL